MKKNKTVFLCPYLKQKLAYVVADLAIADREELESSHPKVSALQLITQFVRASSEYFIFSYKKEPRAAGGITKEGCVWMLTTRSLTKCPKAFTKAARIWLSKKMLSYPVLFNWVDENHHTARRFITHLGGVFTGEYQILSGRKFLFFTFRRQSMGGIIQAGRNYTSTAAQAIKQHQKNRQYFTDQASRARQARFQTQLDNERQTNYLFRSAAEKKRLLAASARLENSTLQNNLARAGVDGSSVTAQLLLEKNKLAAQEAQEKIARETAAQVNAADEKTAQMIAALRNQETAARKKVNQKSSVWKITKQLFSWFK